MADLRDTYKGLVMILTVPGLYCLFVWFGRRLKRNHGVRLGILYHLFALSLAVYIPAAIVKLEWNYLRHVGAAVFVLGATFIIALIDRFVWDLYFRQRHKVSVPKFFTEVVRLAIIVIAIFLVLEFDYDQTVKGLLIAPGILAVVIGLAMQDLLGNIIAGMSLQASKSFVHGDWLLIENRHAEVIEINWRATRMRTIDDISIEVPNKEIARQTIINLYRPQRLHAIRIPITLDYSAPPTRAKDVLLHAAANARGVAPEPKPRVFLKEFGASGIEYEIKFWLENHAMFSEVCDAIRTNVWYALRRHGIRIPYPTQTIQLERAPRDKQQEVQTAARILLRQQPLFQCLSDQELDSLLPRGRIIHFGQGEKLIQQGEVGDSMFILVAGQANVLVERNGSPKQIAQLNSGDCFGEMSLLTGEKRSATIVAGTDCEVVEITKAILGQSLQANPQLLDQLSNLLAKRQMETEGILASETPRERIEAQQEKYAATFFDRIHSFFEL